MDDRLLDKDVSGQVFEMRLETISAANARGISDWTAGNARDAFWLSTTRAAYQRARRSPHADVRDDVRDDDAGPRGAPRRERSARHGASPRATARARRRSSRTSFAQRLGLRTGEPTSSRAPRARAFCGRDAASSLVTHRRTIPRLCVAFASLCHIAGERALHACARCRAPPRVATDPIPRRSPGAGPPPRHRRGGERRRERGP